MNYLNKIITTTDLEITLSKKYIETLYLSTNLYEHVEGEATPYDKHLLALNQFYDSLPDGYKYLGKSAGYEWYDLQNYRIGVLIDFDISVRAGWYTCVIQYKQSYLFGLSNLRKEIDLPFLQDITKYHIKRIDVTNIYKSSKDYLNGYGVISTFRKVTTIENKGKIETKYLGSRTTGDTVRWYNKSKELEAKEDYRKINLLSNYFGDIENLYTIELELRRSYLKRCNIDTLDDLDKVYKLYKDIVGSIRIYRDTEENREHIRLNNYNRIETLKFCEYEKYNRPKSNRKHFSRKYFLERFEKSFERYSNSFDIFDGFGLDSKVELLNKIGSIVLGGELKDLSVYVEACKEVKDVDKLYTKIEEEKEWYYME